MKPFALTHPLSRIRQGWKRRSVAVPAPAVKTYATWNPADKGVNSTLTNSNRTATGVSTNGSARSTVGVTTGKHYWEVSSPANTGGPRAPIVGVALAGASLANYPGSDASGWSFYGLNAKKINAGVQTNYGTAWSAATDVYSFLLDADARTLEVWKNGVTTGVMFTGITAGKLYAMTGGDTGSVASQVTANFGASAFKYTPPAGYNAGLYVEGALPNLFTASESLDDAAWVKNGSSIGINAAASPTGAMTADRIQAQIGNNTVNVSQFVTKAAGAIRTFSTYVKAGTVRRVMFGQQVGTGQYTDCVFDLQSLTWPVKAASATVGFEDAGNGWYRIWHTAKTLEAGSWGHYVGPVNNDGTAYNHTTVGIDILAWGMKFEDGPLTAYA